MDDLIVGILELIIELIVYAVDGDSYSRRKKKKYKSYKRSIYSSTPKSNILNSSSSQIFNDRHSMTKTSYSYMQSEKDFNKTYSKQVKEIEKVEKEVIKTAPVLSNEPLTKKEIKQEIKHNTKSKEVRFGVMMLKYVFFQDDLKISLGEVSKIKKFFSKNKDHLDIDDLMEIKNMLRISPDMEQVVLYFKNNELTQRQFNHSFNQVDKIIGDNPKYNYSLKSIRTKLMEEGLF